MRKEYRLTKEELKTLMDACKPVPYMIIGNCMPSSPRSSILARGFAKEIKSVVGEII
jgi:hypothetical protein